ESAQVLGPDLVLGTAAVERDTGGAAIAPVIDKHPAAGLGELLAERLDSCEGAPAAGLEGHPWPALTQYFVIDVDTADGRDRHGSPPWLNFSNYVILADNHRTPRGIMRVGVFCFPTDYGIDIAAERVRGRAILPAA